MRQKLSDLIEEYRKERESIRIISVPLSSPKIIFRSGVWYLEIEERTYEMDDLAFNSLCDATHISKSLAKNAPVEYIEPILNWAVFEGGIKHLAKIKFRKKLEMKFNVFIENNRVKSINIGRKPTMGYWVDSILEGIFLEAGEMLVIRKDMYEKDGGYLLAEDSPRGNLTLGFYVKYNMKMYGKNTVFKAFIVKPGNFVCIFPMYIFANYTARFTKRLWKEAWKEYKGQKERDIQKVIKALSITIDREQELYISEKLIGWDTGITHKDIRNLQIMFKLEKNKRLDNYIRLITNIVEKKTLKNRISVEKTIGSVLYNIGGITSG